MAERRLDGLHVAILVTDYFEQVEMTEPRKALEQAGAQTHIIAPKPGSVHGFNHDVKGDAFKVDQVLDQANPDAYDAVLLPGGALNADKLRMVPAARQFVQAFDEQGKPMAVICHAPWLLVSAGLVEERKLTSYYTLQDDIRCAGGEWVDQAMVRDRNWVTSRNPNDLPEFNRGMVEMFAELTGEAHSQAVMGAGQGDRKDSGMPGGGKGRTDQVGGSGVYPASDVDEAPPDAQAQGPASWGQGTRGAAGYEDSGGSEIHIEPDEEDE